MKMMIAALAVAAVATPLFAVEPTLETQKHDSSLMMDGMKSLNSKVEATWVSKEQTESVAKESASILKDAKTEIAPAVAVEVAAARGVKSEPATPAVTKEQAALKAAKLSLKSDVPAPQDKTVHTVVVIGQIVTFIATLVQALVTSFFDMIH